MYVRDTKELPEEIEKFRKELDELVDNVFESFKEITLGELEKARENFSDLSAREKVQVLATEIVDASFCEEYIEYHAKFYGNLTHDGYDPWFKTITSEEIKVPYVVMMQHVLNYLGIEQEDIIDIKYNPDEGLTEISYFGG